MDFVDILNKMLRVSNIFVLAKACTVISSAISCQWL